LVSVDEYLNSSYEPDMDFVDGVLVTRNLGTRLHGRLKGLLTVYFSRYEESHRIRVFPEVRLRIDAASRRYRVLDVLVLATPYQKTRVITDVPLVIIEINSPEDTFDDIFSRCFDYEKLGVGNIIIMDPDIRRAWLFDHGLLLAAPQTLDLGHATLEFPFDDMFSQLDD